MKINPKTIKQKNLENNDFFLVANEETYYRVNKDQVGNSNSSTSEFETAVINISSAQILTMGDTPIELLPTLDLNEYYEIDKILFEYTHVTTGYTSDLYTVLTGQIGIASEFAIITNTLLNNIGGFNHILEVRKNSTYIEAIETGGSAVIWDPMVMASEQAVYLSTYSRENPTLGDGTLRAIIKYKVRTFGVTE